MDIFGYQRAACVSRSRRVGLPAAIVTMAVLVLVLMGGAMGCAGLGARGGDQQTPDEPVTKEVAIEMAQKDLQESERAFATVLNFDTPKCTKIDQLPDKQGWIASGNEYSTNQGFWCVEFETTDDALLGSITYYLDGYGVVIGEAVRE